MKGILRNSELLASQKPGSDFFTLIQHANQLFMRAENQGLRTQQSIDQWLMASWLTMAAAEVDSFSYTKYSQEERE